MIKMLNLDRIEDCVDHISLAICFIIYLTVVVGSIFISANYSYLDYPYFEFRRLSDLVYLVFAVLMLLCTVLIGKKLRYNLMILYAAFFAVCLSFVLIVPLEPFSDMKEIYDIVVNGLKDQNGYLTRCSNQIPTTLLFWGISLIFGNNILVFKIVNIVCDIVILHYIYRIALLVADKRDTPPMGDPKAAAWYASCFTPVVIYCNHIYNDTIVTMLTLLLLYQVIRNQNGALHFALICFLSVLQYLLRPSGVIYCIAIAMYMVLYQRKIKEVFLYALIVCSLILVIGKWNKSLFQIDSSGEYPVWSYIQMGVNEEEFGFQDGSHSTEWTMQDCIEKYRELGLKRVLKIYGKKAAWVWMEGTYQASRYGLGDENISYTRENVVTDKIRDYEHSQIRVYLEKFMKAQYYLYMVLGGIGLLRLCRGEKRYLSVLMYVICGFFLFYLIWEIKSRYLYSLYPILLLFSFFGFQSLAKPKNTLEQGFVI